MSKVFSRFSLLITSACAVLLLAGCGDERPGSSVTGNRRAPALNQEAQVKSVAQATENTAKKADSPYDMYSESGRHKTPPPPSQAQSIEKEKGLLDGVFGSSPKEKMVSKEERKPIEGNPYYSKDTQAVAPLASAVLTGPSTLESPKIGPTATGAKLTDRAADMEARTLSLPRGYSQVERVESVAEASKPASPPVTPQAAQKKESSAILRFFNNGEPDDAASVEAEKNAEYVPLSSVPKKPERFEEIKKENAGQLDQMKSDHAAAQVQKEALGEEQSDLVDAVPAALTKAKPVVIQGEKPEDAEIISSVAASAPSAPVASAVPAAAPAVAASPSSLPSPTLLQKKKAVTSAY
ncbi:MAG: hypothetical protein EBR02_00310 [Alphaproteobacteria bacterium]|nr:hypothetical protein [Alphaproteobacteria bacterium]